MTKKKKSMSASEMGKKSWETRKKKKIIRNKKGHFKKYE